MKFASRFTSLLVALSIWTIALRADDNTAAPDDGSNQVDPEAVPRAFLPRPEVTPAQRAASAEARKKAEANHEWLMRGYERQLESNDKKTAQEDEDNLYAELYGKADLAKDAGISPSDLEGMAGGLNLHTSYDPEKSSASLRPDLAPVPSAHMIFKPFISTDAPIEPLPYAMPSPLLPMNGSISAKSNPAADDSSTNAEKRQDPFAMDTPGMTAAESNPATRHSMGLTDADLLPSDPVSPERPQRALELELPTGRNADRLEKMQENALSVPGQLPKKAASPVVKAPPLTPESDTEQMVHDPSPLGRHVPDPYEILR